MPQTDVSTDSIAIELLNAILPAVRELGAGVVPGTLDSSGVLIDYAGRIFEIGLRPASAESEEPTERGVIVELFRACKLRGWNARLEEFEVSGPLDGWGPGPAPIATGEEVARGHR